MLKPLARFYCLFRRAVHQIASEVQVSDQYNAKNTFNIPLLLSQRSYQQKASQQIALNDETEKVAVFFDMEYLNQSAITEFSIFTFCLDPKKFHVFTKFSSGWRAKDVLDEVAKKLNINKENLCVFDSDFYHEFDKQFNYTANIFVLGNSHYNLKTFEAALRLYEYKDRNYLYFHDGLYTNLLYTWVLHQHYSWEAIISHYYPSLDIAYGLTTEDLLKSHVHFVKPLIGLTGSSRVIVNADNCIPIIDNEVGAVKVQAVKAFLPIPDYRKVTPFPFDKKGNSFVVAHFGIPHGFKHIDKLIQAVALLRQKYDVTLLLAGYGVGNFVSKLSMKESAFIQCEESPSGDKILSLMKGADVVVQLRWPVLGQASGVVSEMLGLGLKCITTKGFVNESFKDYVIELSPQVTVVELAEVIEASRGKMEISPEDHIKLLRLFSYESAAQLIFNEVTQQTSNTDNTESDVMLELKNETLNHSLTSKTSNKKLRILYGASHRILRFEEVALFIEAGFEVIPVKAHWEVFAIQEPGVDEPSHPLYPKWRETCTLSDDMIDRIQSIDILKYQNLNTESGNVSDEEAALINKCIDIIYIPNLLPAVPRVLQWFTGLTLFRVYGEGKIMTYDEWAEASGVDLNQLRLYDARYATMLMLFALNGPEHASILGSNVFHVGPCVTPSRLKGKWKGENSAKICNTALSYICENPHWTDMYHTLSKEFGDVPMRFLGKNNKNHDAIKNDHRVTGIIYNDEEFVELLTNGRCLLDPGTSPFHTHYTPIEAILVGIPVIFLESSGMGREILRVIPKEDLVDCGICASLIQAKVIVKRCLDDIDYAKRLSANQRKIADKMFAPASVLKQIKEFASVAPDLVARARMFAPLMSDKFNKGKDDIFATGNKFKFGAPVKRTLAWFVRIISTSMVVFLIHIIRKTYKLLYPAQFQVSTAEFLFKSCFPSTSDYMTQLREKLMRQQLYIYNLEKEVHKSNETIH